MSEMEWIGYDTRKQTSTACSHHRRGGSASVSFIFKLENLLSRMDRSKESKPENKLKANSWHGAR